MSVGRRMLPKPPNSNSNWSHSLDRNGDIHADSEDKTSLNSSFSGQASLPASAAHSPQSKRKYSSDCPASTTALSQPSPPFSDSRGEVEGSSDNNSPPTSVIQGLQGDKGQLQVDPTLDWLSGSFNRQGKWRGTKTSKEFLSHHEELNSEKFHPKFPTSKEFHSLEEEVTFLRNLRTGDGNSHGSSKQSDSMSDSGGNVQHNIPYEVLLQDLTDAKRQLQELWSLECASLQGGKLQSRSQDSDSSLMKQNLVRATLAKQTLEIEKKEMLRKMQQMETTLNAIRSEKGEKDKMLRLQLEDFVKKQGSNDLAERVSLESDLRAYDEELAVAKDAISNLRTSFNESDPNQHILDTLEQCISVIIEKNQHVDQHDKHSRMSSLDYARANEGQYKMSVQPPSITKILYFTNRSVTPFMSPINKRIGEITLRDFKNLFDRPGFFRYHFKSVDQEFGMVKEEISQDDAILPGAEGKIVAWIDED